ncbi:MAG TPA: hypothetical protein VLC10_00740 [Patescibacteria group bacterium]|nr:hypothetical protein [Patescibacteria group bacterium]
MSVTDGPAQDEPADGEKRLHRLTELFAPHVRDLVADAAHKKTLFLPLGQCERVAIEAYGSVGVSVQHIIDRALAGEAKLMVREWTLLLTEHALDDGRTLRLSTLDEAMLPPLADDLARIYRECCERRLAGPTLSRIILARVRKSLPEGERIPADARAYFRSRGIAVVS